MTKMRFIRRVRTEEAKRRIYGDRGGHLHFKEHRFVPRPDGISNAITTFDKDNYVFIEYDAPAAQVKSEKWREGCDGIATNGTKK